MANEAAPFQATLVSRFAVVSTPAQAVARWSARLLCASFLLAGLLPAESGHSLFASLTNELWDAARCSGRAPRWLSICLLVLAFAMIRGALWSAIGESLGRGLPTGTLAMRRALVLQRPVIRAVWVSPAFLPVRRRMVRIAFGVTVLAGLSGAVSVALAAWVLRGSGSSSSLFAWGLIMAGGLTIDRLEDLLGTERLRDKVPPPPTKAEAVKRYAEYVDRYPNEKRSGSSLLYAYSRLERDQITRRLIELSLRGPVGRVLRWSTVVLVAVVFPLLPAPSVDHFKTGGFVSCSYATTFGFFDVAKDNLGLATVAVAALLATSPVTLSWTWWRMMGEWKFPTSVRLEVLRRERGLALRNVPYQMLSAAVWAAAFSLVLWLSAEVAVSWNSPAAAGGRQSRLCCLAV
jgi:hypothetical protein